MNFYKDAGNDGCHFKRQKGFLSTGFRLHRRLCPRATTQIEEETVEPGRHGGSMPPRFGDDTFALISGQVYHDEAGVHALDKQLDSGTFFVLIE